MPDKSPQVDQVCRGGNASERHGESGTRGSRPAAESDARDVSAVAVLIEGPRGPIEALLVNDPPLEIGMFVVDATVDHRYTDAGSVKSVALSDVGVDFGGDVVGRSAHCAIRGNVDDRGIRRQLLQTFRVQPILCSAEAIDSPEKAAAGTADFFMMSVGGMGIELNNHIHGAVCLLEIWCDLQISTACRKRRGSENKG